MSEPRFSIIVPAYNSATTIDSCLRSVLGQTISSLELIVVDDGSSDQTPEVVAAFAAADDRVRLVERPNGGVSAARNTGIDHARGRFVGFLDHDDAWLPRYLELVGKRLDAYPDAGIAHADCWSLLDEGKLIHRLTTLQSFPPVGPEEGPERFLMHLLAVNFLTASSVTVTRAALGEVGGFSAEATPSDDWDLWLRIASAGYHCVLAAAEPLVLLRETSHSQSKDAGLMARSACRAMQRALELQPPGSETQRIAARRLAELRAAQRRIERPSRAEAIAESSRARLRPLKRALLHRRNWRRPNPQVQSTLRELGEI